MRSHGSWGVSVVIHPGTLLAEFLFTVDGVLPVGALVVVDHLRPVGNSAMTRCPSTESEPMRLLA